MTIVVLRLVHIGSNKKQKTKKNMGYSEMAAVVISAVSLNV